MDTKQFVSFQQREMLFALSSIFNKGKCYYVADGYSSYITLRLF